MDNTIKNEMIIAGYQALRSDIHFLVKERLTANPIELYDCYYELDKAAIKRVSEKLGIDFLDSETNILEAKEEVGLWMIEDEIKSKLTKKKSYDQVLNELGIRLRPEEKRITNFIQDCEWFQLFNSPMGHNWFSQNANNLLATCDKADENYPKLEKMIENIKANWVEIDPQQPLPDIKLYQNLVNKEVPTGIKDMLVKP